MNLLTKAEGPHAGTGNYAWGCQIHGLHFLYVYGPVADYRQLVCPDVSGGDVIHKGYGHTLDEVRGLARSAASRIASIYKDVGSVRVASTEECITIRKNRGSGIFERELRAERQGH